MQCAKENFVICIIFRFLFLPFKICGQSTTERVAALFFVLDEVARLLFLAMCTVHLHNFMFVRKLDTIYYFQALILGTEIILTKFWNRMKNFQNQGVL